MIDRFLRYNIFPGSLMPVNASLLLTAKCNLRCSMCGFWRNTGPAEDLPSEQWCSVLRQLRDIGVESISFQGGEPTLYKEIYKLVSESSKLGFLNRQIITNGSSVKVIREIAPMLTNVTISLDSIYNEVHDTIRGVAGTGERARGLLLELNRKMSVCWSMVIQKINIGELEDAIAFAVDNNLKNMIVSFAAGSTVGDTAFCDPSLYGFDYSTTEKIIRKIYKNKFPVLQPSLFDTLISLQRYKTGFSHRCDDPGNSCVIMPDGAVHVCCGKLPPIGNCLERSLKVLWNDPETKTFIMNARKGQFQECHTCQHVRTYFNVKAILYNLIFAPRMSFRYYFQNHHMVRRKTLQISQE